MNETPMIAEKKSTAPIYFVIRPCVPVLEVPKWTPNYTLALKAARELGCIVTNESWLRSQGEQIRVAFSYKTTKGRLGVDYTRPVKVSLDNINLEQF
jgi:hypothetical protein